MAGREGGSRARAAAMVNHVVMWAADEGGRIPAASFLAECDVAACMAAGKDVDQSRLGGGTATLEYACEVLGVPMPDDLDGIEGLPGRGSSRGARTEPAAEEPPPRSLARSLLSRLGRRAG